MSDIIWLEIKNLSNEEKEQLLKKYHRKIKLNPNYKTFEEFVGEENLANMEEEEWRDKREEYLDWVELDWKNKKYQFEPYFSSDLETYNDVDEVLEAYFKDYPNDFIAFQANNKNSLYRQALKQHDFKHFKFKDIVETLTSEQKKEIIDDISNLVSDLACKDEDVSLWDIEPEFKKEIEVYEKLDVDGKWNYEFKADYPEMKKHLNLYKNNEYFLQRLNGKYDYYSELKFFKNDDDVIYFGLKEPKIGNVLLYRHKEILNPHHIVNEWIVTNHELELDQKDGFDQAEKFEQPKLKM
ncbi:hypothetical protein [Mesomycoplasma ovipneumoniae]|uniref:hypothetical protein n=1 Tax=Mesomycoplasma ovipneumoniae TaxID=29562 RepID=UPI002963F8DF|nr:hypothetical protein [Mesomycoplasma ovipneumoniae]MDW2861079.1 hypothetical protein [Mesomycoplasma ovipneumoniae]MDW2891220.1 hypothetical protein [Mesomycoplasma ovipneumoniae]